MCGLPVNAGKFIYDISAQELAELLEAVQGIPMTTCWTVESRTCGRWITSSLRRSAARWRPSQPLAAVAGVRQPDDATATFKQPGLSEPDSVSRADNVQ